MARMDIGTMLGLILAAIVIVTSVAMSGGSFLTFWDATSALVVVGGTAGAVCLCIPLRQLMRTPSVVTKLMAKDTSDLADVIRQIVRLAEVARREGFLALEPRLDEITHPFMKMGVQLIIDGSRPESIEEILRTEIDTMSLRHREGKMIFDQMGRFAPAFGMIGTLLGLIVMLGQLSDPAKLGTGMAVALVTTLYGVALSNVSFLPIAERLAQMSRQELIERELILRGLLAIQAGEYPRLIEYKLSTFLQPSARKLAA
jgi:chemotaxis protein MotA